ncbi:transcription repressor OFP13 [Gastrolobium bilobum]|uniref:transcription repressor OFP13 n=1 Tax=Gastrolobium bilobum TaxID=150636 RepID=UPI002AB218FE|nr:transcription repressor OFP13 [Gastrolobium bilobum]
MGKKALKLPSLFKTKEAPTRKHPWQFLPSCGHPKTLSFRAGDDIFKTVNSVFFDPTESTIETPKSCFTASSESASFSTESEDYCYYDGESLEILVRGVRSERLFFEPGDTSSILEKAKASGFPFKESVVLAMESEDPYEDFRKSMEEMVESHGVKDWEGLEELLSWYLRVNGKNNHGFIVGAFVDLLTSIAASNSCSDSTIYSSAVSSFASSPLCLSEGQNEIIECQHEDTVTS